ncbi:hypothetical protein [Aeromonas enteropelogenes]|uniref:hypothetical protein n=1 Tax=Aeromonas enteropelogenes TaxID=29489 RepID=UPI003BA36DDB
MKIDFDEMKKILSVFLEANTACITLQNLGFFSMKHDETELFLFHFSLLAEAGLISDQALSSNSLEALGIVFHSGGVGGRALPIRLTMAGHDFAKALNQKPVLERIKKELSDAPFGVVKKAAGQWFSKVLEDKLGL